MPGGPRAGACHVHLVGWTRTWDGRCAPISCMPAPRSWLPGGGPFPGSARSAGCAPHTPDTVGTAPPPVPPAGHADSPGSASATPTSAPRAASVRTWCRAVARRAMVCHRVHHALAMNRHVMVSGANQRTASTALCKAMQRTVPHSEMPPSAQHDMAVRWGTLRHGTVLPQRFRRAVRRAASCRQHAGVVRCCTMIGQWTYCPSSFVLRPSFDETDRKRGDWDDSRDQF